MLIFVSAGISISSWGLKRSCSRLSKRPNSSKGSKLLVIVSAGVEYRCCRQFVLKIILNKIRFFLYKKIKEEREGVSLGGTRIQESQIIWGSRVIIKKNKCDGEFLWSYRVIVLRILSLKMGPSLENTHKILDKILDKIEETWEPFWSNTTLDQNNRPFSKRVYAILQQKRPWEVKEGQGRGAKLFTPGSELQRTKLVINLHKLEELDTCLSRVGQSEWKKLS